MEKVSILLLYFCKNPLIMDNDEIVAAMVLNHQCNDGYKKFQCRHR
jgi:hypothetical protein